MMFLETEKKNTVMSGRGRVRARGPGRRAGPRRGQGGGVRMRGGGRFMTISHMTRCPP